MAHLEDELGDIVRKARYGLGLSLDEVARRAGMGPDQLDAVEGYRRSVSRAESDALAKILGLSPTALWQIATGKYVPAPPRVPGEIVVDTFTFPPIDSHGYIVHWPRTGESILVDPGGNPRMILERCASKGLRLSAILITHGHADHVDGVREVQAATDAPVYAHPDEWRGDGLVSLAGHFDGSPRTIRIGEVTVEVIPSPGHTPSGLSFYMEGVGGGVAAVGDTLFAGSLGRAHQGPAYYGKLLQSARRLLQLPEETLLLPGHGPLTTVREERAHNPFVAIPGDDADAAGERR